MAARTWAKWAKIRPETRFFVIFSNLVYQFSLKLNTMIACNNVRCLVYVKSTNKFFQGPNFGQRDQNPAQNQVFCNFLKFGSLVFLEIAYNDNLQQCLTSCRGRICEKKFRGLNLDQRDQNRVRKQVFCHFIKFVSSVFLEIAYNDSLQQCITSSISKTHKQNFWRPNMGQKVRPKISFFASFFLPVGFISFSINSIG